MTLAADGRSADRPFVVAVVGAGYFARFHLEAWPRVPGVRLAALCDLDAAKAAEAAAAHGIPAVYDDARRMLDETKPDLLDVATGPESHHALVALAAERGIACICQKPLAPTYPEAVALVELAERAGIPLIAHENERFKPWWREIRRLIDAGRLGRLHGASFRLRPGDGQGPRAYLDRQPYFQTMPRLLVHETAIHWIDSFRYLFGETTGVYAHLRRLNPVLAGEDAGHFLMAFGSGALACFDGNRLNDHVADDPRLTMGEMTVEGEGGVLRLDGFARLFWKPHREAEREHAYAWEKRSYGGDAVRATLAHAVAHLRDGAPLENSGRAYLRNLEIEEAIYRSAAERRWIEV